MIAALAILSSLAAVSNVTPPPSAVGVPPSEVEAPLPEVAERMIENCLEYAARSGRPPLSVAVVDEGGALVLFKRQNGASPVIGDAAVLKAQTAAKAPTGALAELSEDASIRDAFVLMRLTTPPGGIPLLRGDGSVRGAVGVSGGQTSQDSACAEHALTQSALAPQRGVWIGTWETSPVGLPTVERIGSLKVPSPTTVKGTLRYRLRISQGGRQIRLKFSNRYGKIPLSLAAVSVGMAGAGLDALPGTLRRAGFSGNESTVIPSGESSLTDPIDMQVAALTDLVVSIYVPGGISLTAWPSITSPNGPMVVSGADATLTEHLSASIGPWMRPMVCEVDALANPPRQVVVALGDSITDGSVNPDTGERGWPAVLSRRLSARGISVLNAGIGGNRLLASTPPMLGASALSRLDEDVFSVPGLTHIIALVGINDIGSSGRGGRFGDAPLVKPKELIDGYSQIITSAHKRGIRVLGATMLPFEEAEYYSDDKEMVRQAINEWIRNSKKFDGVIDFDLALRNPNYPRKLELQYDSGDHLHPSPAGYRKMGEVVDLRVFN